MTEDKKKIERCVNDITRTLSRLVEIFGAAEAADASMVQRAFAHVTRSVQANERMALLALTNKTFSLDSASEDDFANHIIVADKMSVGELTPTPHPVTIERPSTGPLPQKRPRAEGRLVGTKEPVFTLDPPEKPKPAKVDPAEIPDKTGMIVDAGFIED